MGSLFFFFVMIGCHEQRRCCRQTNISVADSVSLSMTFMFIDDFQREIVFGWYHRDVALSTNDTQYLLYTIISFLISRTTGNFHSKFRARCVYSTKNNTLLSQQIRSAVRIRQHESLRDAVNFFALTLFIRSKSEKSHKNVGRKMLQSNMSGVYLNMHQPNRAAHHIDSHWPNALLIPPLDFNGKWTHESK